MSHRGQAHARRRAHLWSWNYAHGLEGSHAAGNVHVTPDFDDTTYDDVIPHRLRGTLVLDDGGEPPALTDLVADRSLT